MNNTANAPRIGRGAVYVHRVELTISGFDEKCPFCGVDMECRRDWDYETEYERECRSCRKLVHISVHMTPEFETSKPVCVKCGNVEIQKGHYCQKCKEELDAIRGAYT